MDTSFPTKRVTAGAVMRNLAGDLLIVKPGYRDGWLLPGGICEQTEAPAVTLVREVREELGIEARIAGLLCVDYLSAHDGYDESVHFLFECEPLSKEETDLIRLPSDELLAFRFCPDAFANDLLVPTIARRLQRLRQPGTGAAVYLENGTDLLHPPT
jgi:8-oxo-dGTP pyrophosphatase MutT (NUDIX family)